MVGSKQLRNRRHPDSSPHTHEEGAEGEREEEEEEKEEEKGEEEEEGGGDEAARLQELLKELEHTGWGEESTQNRSMRLATKLDLAFLAFLLFALYVTLRYSYGLDLLDVLTNVVRPRYE